VSRYQKGKTNLDFTEATDSEWQWHQLGHMQVCTSLKTDNHASTPPFSFLHAGCSFCRPTNSVKALKATTHMVNKPEPCAPTPNQAENCGYAPATAKPKLPYFNPVRAGSRRVATSSAAARFRIG